MDKTALFGIALKAAGLSMGQWIAQNIRPGVSESFVYQVLRGDKSSERVEAAINKLIAEQGPVIEKSFRGFAQAA